MSKTSILSLGPSTFLGLLLFLFGFSNKAMAESPQAELCEQAAALVASESNVPLDVLRAISLTETGRQDGAQMRPWAWTVNMEGAGKWFDTQDAARAYVYKHFKRGARSFDVGCFQINYKWHGDNFESIEHMFDPVANATYAAKFLQTLHDELGSWEEAAGAYHSRTPKFANIYKAKFRTFRSNLGPMVETTAKTTASARVNSFPLLKPSGSPSPLGSLVPQTGSRGSLLTQGDAL